MVCVSGRFRNLAGWIKGLGVLLMDKILHDLKDSKLWELCYGIFLIMGNAGFCPSTVLHVVSLTSLDTASTYQVRLRCPVASKTR